MLRKTPAEGGGPRTHTLPSCPRNVCLRSLDFLWRSNRTRRAQKSERPCRWSESTHGHGHLHLHLGRLAPTAEPAASEPSRGAVDPPARRGRELSRLPHCARPRTPPTAGGSGALLGTTRLAAATSEGAGAAAAGPVSTSARQLSPNRAQGRRPAGRGARAAWARVRRRRRRAERVARGRRGARRPASARRAARARAAAAATTRPSASTRLDLFSTRGLGVLCGAGLERAVRADPEAAGDARRRSGTATRASCEEAGARHDPRTFLLGRLGHRALKGRVEGPCFYTT